MNRRSFVAAALGSAALSVIPPSFAFARPVPERRTRWRVSLSEGFDAIAFLGPLSGGELYTDYYADELARFAPKLPDSVRAEVRSLWAEAAADGFGLLGPTLALLFSVNNAHRDIATVIEALRDRRARLLPRYQASQYWSESDWTWFDSAAPRLEIVFEAMRVAGFAQFWAQETRTIQGRIEEVQRSLADYDVVHWQEKLTGRAFEPTIEVVLLQFSKPHGIKVQGQTFLQSAQYNTATTVRIAAHEMLHPPLAMDGLAATAALGVFARDPLIMKVVKEHDPRWGYTTLEGYFDENLVQALDQLISEGLGVARNPADRWRKADDGIHILAAGFYGMLRQDRWTDSGGDIERWLAKAVCGGRLGPAAFHPVAAKVLERPLDRLWPL